MIEHYEHHSNQSHQSQGLLEIEILKLETNPALVQNEEEVEWVAILSSN